MGKKTRRSILLMLIGASVVLALFLIMQPLQILRFWGQIDFLFPKGEIALKERNLLFITQLLMIFVIIPVYVLTFIFSWKYSVHNPKGIYDPDLIDNQIAEYIWWGLPLIMTLLVSVLTWVKTHELDPFKPIESNKKEMNIQVVALQWKWLFIYPEENIASANFLQFPKETPIRFDITADAPMNSFWIPRLGGQMYAMPGMRTQLNLIANEEGDFKGASANLSGEGFSDMHFIARASSEEEFRRWADSAKNSAKSLNLEEYRRLASPSSNKEVMIYRLEERGLFDRALHQYMHPK